MSSGTANDIRFEPMEILLARVTFPDTQETKARPVLVISNFSSKARSPESRHFICMPLTSNPNVDSTMIKIENKDLESKPLAKPSQVICNYIFTMTKNDAMKKIGTVTPRFYQQVITTTKQNIF